MPEDCSEAAETKGTDARAFRMPGRKQIFWFCFVLSPGFVLSEEFGAGVGTGW